MKRSIFLAALVLIGAGCLAQKKNVNSARYLVDAEVPDFAAARNTIKDALTNDETKDQANTWYVAGYIGYKEFDSENLNRQMGRNIDVNKWGASVMESMEYWNKAYELALIPTYDKKGKAKYDTRTPKNLLPKLQEYFLQQPLVIAGFTAYEAGDASTAYDMFTAHVNIPEMQIYRIIHEMKF